MKQRSAAPMVSAVPLHTTDAAPEIPLAASFPIVGIGASAGGLAAFEAFFSGMPADTEGPGMAFVLVQHLAPDHESILTDLLRRYTRMQVFEVEDGMTVEPNCAYIIPPNRDMAFINGALQLLEPSAPRGQRLPIDFFFRSLAMDQHERAIGVVLSGTGSDGTLGVRAIKGEGGMVMVQHPDSTEYNGMPQSAIATGVVDYILPPAEMAAQIIAYAARAVGSRPVTGPAAAPRTEHALKKIFVLLRALTGHDFSHYKLSTVNRRVERRMAVQQVEHIDEYVRFLQQTPAEADALFRDLLIGVTGFFRDPAAFHAIEKSMPRLCAGTAAGAAVRLWSPGCSTGEEAYSLAIILQETMEKMAQSVKVQVFATDIDSRAIATARAGVYPASIAADITPERLARFFSADADGSVYRVNKKIRDMLIFSEQDVIKDPPFSRIDLISCRNLMIYMDAELQKKLIPLFYYALNPGGMLLLGTSESVGEFSELFETLDGKAKLYRRNEEPHGARRKSSGRFIPPLTALDGYAPRAAGSTAAPVKLPLRELAEQALLQHVPCGALVNGQGDILYVHGRTGMYLETVPGEAGVNNILKMARDGLRNELTVALHKAATTKGVVRNHGLRVRTNGHITTATLTVSPVAFRQTPGREPPLYLVILDDTFIPPGTASAGELRSSTAAGVVSRSGGKRPGKDGRISGKRALARINELQRELHAKEEYLRAATDELKSSNEEMQSVNEELQSTNEELETSKEELQSVNEELSTVNAELQAKVQDLSRANNDMNNLLAGTGIATIFVDHELRILRFTPAASRIINLILTDVGRPVAHMASNLIGYDSLVADLRNVLDTLIPRDVEVQTVDGTWYAMHMQPYRTLDNIIEGAVITSVDITEAKKTAEALRRANDMHRLAVVVRDAHDAITVQDMDGRIIAWNPGAAALYGWSEAEALAMNVRDRIPESRRDAALEMLQKLCRAEVLESYRTQRIAKSGAVLDVTMIATALTDDSGKMYAIATTERAVGTADIQREGGAHDR